MWLVRSNEQLGKLNRVGVDIVAALPYVAGWQALNLAGLTEDRIKRVVSRLPDGTFSLDTISAELNRVFASVQMSEPVSSAPGRAWRSNERERVPRSVRTHSPLGSVQSHVFRQEEPKIRLEPLRSHNGTRLRKFTDTEEEDNDCSDTIDPATCKNMCETRPRAWTLAEMMWQLQVWTIPNWRLRVCNLRNCLKPFPSSKQPGEEPQTKTVTHGVLLAARAKLVNHLDDNMCPAVRSHRHTDDRPAQIVGIAQRARPQPQQRRGTELQAKLDKRQARSVCHACGQLGHWAGDPQCPGRPVNVIELEDEVQESEPNQDAGMRQVLSVQVDVPDVRLLQPSTRLVLAMDSMDVGRREGARVVIDTAARYRVAGRAWDRAHRQICNEKGIGHVRN